MTEEMTESQEAVQTMQADLHEKGALLSKVWSDLFSLFTKYQAELFVRENSISVAEKQMAFQKSLIEDMKAGLAKDDGNRSEALLQEELNSKEQAISKFKIELTTTNSLLQRVQSDLASHQNLLEKTRTEMLEKDNKLMRMQVDNEKFKMELSVKDDQLIVKDRLLQKIQDEMRRESDESKERLRQFEEVLDSERKAHAATRRRAHSKQATGSQIIEIPDSPPTLDLSGDNHDFAISSIMSLADAQRKDSYSASSQAKSSSVPLNSPSFQQNVSWSPHMRAPRTSTMTLQNKPDTSESEPRKIHTSIDSTNPTSSSNIDSFSHLNQIDTSQMTLGDMEMEHSDSNLSHLSESNSSPVPVSGPIPSGSLPDMLPGMSGDIKEESAAEYDWMEGQVAVPATMEAPINFVQGNSSSSIGGCRECREILPDVNIRYHVCNKTKPYKCTHCRSQFMHKGNLTLHMKRHTSSEFKCSMCEKTFYRRGHLMDHIRMHTGEKPYKCQFCSKGFIQKGSLNTHLRRHHPVEYQLEIDLAKNKS